MIFNFHVAILAQETVDLENPPYPSKNRDGSSAVDMAVVLRDARALCNEKDGSAWAVYGVGSGIQLEINVVHVSRKVYDFQFKGTAFVLLGDLESL